jgi:hypothetical protein
MSSTENKEVLKTAFEALSRGTPVTIEIRRAEGPEASELTAVAFAAKRHWGYPEAWIDLWADELTVDASVLSRK